MDARLPDAFLNYVVSFLPPQAAPGPQGGRRPIDHATVVKVIWFVLTVGCRWKDVPREIRSNRRQTWPTPFESDNALCRCRIRQRRYS